MRKTWLPLVSLMALPLMAHDCGHETCCYQDGEAFLEGPNGCDEPGMTRMFEVRSPEECLIDPVCCSTAGVWEVVPESYCTWNGGEIVPDQECRVDLDTDEPTIDCKTFCSGIQAACPSDVKCLHSCDKIEAYLTADMINCAEQATDCSETNACWAI